MPRKSPCPSIGATTPGRATAPDGRRWLQINAAPDGTPGADRAILLSVAEAAGRLRRERVLDLWFWQRKEPGLRLRFRARPGREEDASAALAPVLRGLVRRGVARRWSASVYEPEVHLFGGPAMMEAAHRWALADAAVQAASLARGGTGVTPAVLTLAVLNDLFRRGCDSGPEEVWDVWCRLAAMHDIIPGAGRPLPVVGLEDIAALAPEACQAMAAANARLASALSRAWSTGRLTTGRRAALSMVALFHWNRLGLEPDIRRRLIDGMTAALDPHSGMEAILRAYRAAVSSAPACAGV
ncbi:thiopeptide-type bacteriocin biosynthesis protein [Azospirillum canadense]|uniref:thiopeptide-type bacteriocin biosynthesis protein n=1 Tax=Azospirillum canadense TaxID=403962 RepID=UPI002225EC83|nr:thiopeptide-type bacteriocin biosynthesis protein [Azospirillum canadense]MCW2241610.1 thiopeptide-type bacteriocin biosynthesis protein [Azospirillum canadense]